MEENMQSIRKITQEILQIGYMKGVLETYEEMAASRMQEVRGELLSARNFYEGLTQVSQEIGMDIVGIVGSETVIPAYVLIGSNASMFGDLPERLVERFAKDIENFSGDVYVMGEMAARLLKMRMPNLDFKVLRMPNEELDRAMMELVVDQFRIYRQVRIYYGQFINIVRQEVSTRDLAGELTLDFLAQEDRDERERRLKYLYEPNVTEVGKKLSKEVFAGVFESTHKESLLSKFAARLIHLDQSLSNLDNIQNKMHKTKVRMKRKNDNKKQGLRAAAAGKRV